MLVYQLTPAERQLVETLNSARKDVLLIVCDLPEIGPTVVKQDL